MVSMQIVIMTILLKSLLKYMMNDSIDKIKNQQKDNSSITLDYERSIKKYQC